MNCTDGWTEEEKRLLSQMLYSEAINGVCIVPPHLLEKAKEIKRKLNSVDKINTID